MSDLLAGQIEVIIVTSRGKREAYRPTIAPPSDVPTRWKGSLFSLISSINYSDEKEYNCRRKHIKYRPICEIVTYETFILTVNVKC